MNVHTIFLSFLCLIAVSCNAQTAFNNGPEIRINRFDSDLYQYLEDNQHQESFFTNDSSFLKVYANQVINIGKPDSAGFSDRLNKFFSEPTLRQLYKDEQQTFSDVQTIEKELSYGFGVLMNEFPSLKLPQVYMHVSGLNQNVIVTDEILSISADKYLGVDYPMYQSFFYDYQRQLMSTDRITPDYFLGFMMANFPFKGNEDVLLDRMLYEGKLRYILSKLIPERQIWEFVGYNKEQYLWCSNNQSRIWKSILERQHLYNADYLVTSHYLAEAPHTAFLPSESPGRVGVWLGYQIIISYMKHHPDTSFQELINNVDYQELLKQAKYKP